MNNPVFPTTDARCFIGGPATGKTFQLLERAHALVAAGERSVLLVCASPQHAEIARQACHQRILDNVEVCTPRDLALEVLDDPEVIRLMGRSAHILDPTEELLLFEDMKTCGLKVRRLRELLAFLYRGWSDLADDDPSWLCTTEEKLVVNLLQENLAFTEGMLKEELTPLAYKALRDNPAAARRHARAHVLVDDYSTLGRAAQALTNLIATLSITIAADDTPAPNDCEAYPYEAWLDDLQQANPKLEIRFLSRCYRPAAIVHTLNSIRGESAHGGVPLEAALDEAGHVKDNALEVYMEAGLADECRAIVECVRQNLAGSTQASDILIVGVNGVWRANVAKALSSYGIPVHRLDAVSEHTNDNAETLAKRIARDPNDSLAWRSWCGLGDHLARSAAVAELRRCAPARMNFAEALRLLDQGALPTFRKDDPLRVGLVERYKAGLTAAQLANSVSPLVQEEHLEAAEAVLVGRPLDAFGCEARLVIFGGFVNGFIPSRTYCDPGVLVGHARMRARKSDLKALHLCVAAARKRFVLTGFTSCGLETAERLGLHIARIRLVDGVRTCTIEPSELLDLISA